MLRRKGQMSLSAFTDRSRGEPWSVEFGLPPGCTEDRVDASETAAARYAAYALEYLMRADGTRRVYLDVDLQPPPAADKPGEYTIPTGLMQQDIAVLERMRLHHNETHPSLAARDVLTVRDTILRVDRLLHQLYTKLAEMYTSVAAIQSADRHRASGGVAPEPETTGDAGTRLQRCFNSLVAKTMPKMRFMTNCTDRARQHAAQIVLGVLSLSLSLAYSLCACDRP